MQSVPHIAVAKPPHAKWGDVGDIVDMVLAQGRFSPHPTSVEVQQDPTLQFFRVPLTGWQKVPALVAKHADLW